MGNSNHTGLQREIVYSSGLSWRISQNLFKTFTLEIPMPFLSFQLLTLQQFSFHSPPLHLNSQEKLKKFLHFPLPSFPFYFLPFSSPPKLTNKQLWILRGGSRDFFFLSRFFSSTISCRFLNFRIHLTLRLDMSCIPDVSCNVNLGGSTMLHEGCAHSRLTIEDSCYLFIYINYGNVTLFIYIIAFHLFIQ